MIDLTALDSLEAWIRSLLENISVIEQIFDYHAIADHIPMTRVAVCFWVENTSFHEGVFDGGYLLRHMVEFMIVVRDGDKSEIRSVANEILRQFETNENSDITSWAPLSFRIEDVFIEDKRQLIGHLTLSIDQHLPMLVYHQA